MKKKRALSNSRDPFYIDRKDQLAPGVTYGDALDRAAEDIAVAIDAQVLEEMRLQNERRAQLQS